MTNEEDTREAAEGMHDQRLDEGEVDAAIQATRQSGQPMSPELTQKAFNPDQTLGAVEVQSRVDLFVYGQNFQDLRLQHFALVGGYFPWDESNLTEEEKPAFIAATAQRFAVLSRLPENQSAVDNRPVTMHTGRDPRTGQARMTAPGEQVNEHGMIEMVNPVYAAEAAERMRTIDPAQAKQNMRRQQALKILATVVLNPVMDPTGVQVIHIDDEQLRNLKLEYYEAIEAGIPESQVDFIPMAAYAGKLWPSDRPPVRPKLADECGFFQMGSNSISNLKDKIACLKSTDLTQRMQVQVPRRNAPREVDPPVRQIVDRHGRPIANQQMEVPPDPTAGAQRLQPSGPAQPSVSVEPTDPSLNFKLETLQPLQPLSEEALGLPPPPPGRQR